MKGVITIRKFYFLLLVLVVIISLSVSVFAAGEQPSGSNYGYLSSTGTTSYSDYWTASNNNLKQIGLWLSNIRGSSFWYFDGSNVHGTENFFNAITKSLYYIGYQLKYLSTSSSPWAATDVTTVTTYIRNIWNTLNDIDDRLITSNSHLSDIKSYTSNLVNIKSYLSDLHDIFASPEDLALKNAQDQNVSTATSDFLSGSSSSTSVGISDLGNMKSIGQDVSDFFDTGVSGTSIFDIVSDDSADGPWTWFSQATLDSLSPSNSRGYRKSNDSSGDDVVDFYSDKLSALNFLLGEVAEK